MTEKPRTLCPGIDILDSGTLDAGDAPLKEHP